MTDKSPKYIDGVGWRYDTEHSMTRRMSEHDYRGRCIYMITMSTEGRRALFGKLTWQASDASDAEVKPTELGAEVERCWYGIKNFYPDVEPLTIQLMPDHIHGLLFVKKETEAHLGKIINGFKIGCNRAFRRLAAEPGPGAEPGAGAERGSGVERLCLLKQKQKQTQAPAPAQAQAQAQALTQAQDHEQRPGCKQPKHPEKGLLFEPGYQDSVLMGKDQLAHMFNYIKDNPRRLALKRMNPDLFRVVTELKVGDTQFAAIGNRWLIDRPLRMQVRCHNNTQTENLRLIERQKAYFLERGRKGGVVVSPCISAGEKEIARAALDAGVPLIVILENGFAPMYKPPGKYFEACAKGLLLMLAPWPYHMESRTISRAQCLALNDMAFRICTEPWTYELERSLCDAERIRVSRDGFIDPKEDQ